MSNKPRIYKYTTLRGLINRLRDDLNNQDFVLLFAYNGTGKTRISMEFKERGKRKRGIERDTLYYNAYTEDLFHWHNDLENDSQRHLIINSESKFFDGFKELALEEKIFAFLERYADFDFRIDYEQWTITFSRDGNDHIKISRGEENIFVWCIFLAIVELTVDGSEAYDWVKYIYIDDPISSLDDNNAIAVASDLAKLLERGKDRFKTIISSHHGLFFNVMCNELKKFRHKKYFLHRSGSSNAYTLRTTNDTPFFHHVAVLSEIQKAIESGNLYTYHFNMLRGVLEKTSTFFGFDDFSACIHGISDEDLYSRALNLLSHGKYSAYEPKEMVEDTKRLFESIFEGFTSRYRFDLPDLMPRQTTQGNQP